MAKLYFKVGSDWEEVVRLRNEIVKLKQELMSMDGTQSPAAFKALNVQLAASNQRLDELVTNAAKAGAVMENDLKRKINNTAKASDELSEEIIKQHKIIRETQEDIRLLSEQYSKMGKYSPQSVSTLNQLNKAKVALNEQRYALGELQDQQARNRLEVRKLTREYKKFTDGATNADVVVKSLTDSLKRTAAEIGGLMAIKKFGSDVIDATGKMQQLQVALSTILQSKSQADQLVGEIIQFAAKTPFDLDDVATGAKQLLAYGSSADKVVDELSMLGDVASGLQIPIGQLIYLYGTLRTQGRAMTVDIRQFAGRGIPIYEELAKVLGVAKDQVGALVTEGKVGFAEVEQAFKNMTSEGGKFNNLMENSAGTWPQRLSNIQDTLFQKLNDFGNKYKEVFEFGIGTTENLVESLDDVISVIGSLIAAYGAYKAALIAVAAWQKASSLLVLTKNFISLAKGVNVATAAMKAFNITSKANLFGALLSVIAGVTTAIYMFSKRTQEATAAQEALSNVNKKADEEFSKQAATIDRLNSVLRSETSSIDQKKKALSELQSIIPNYNANLNEEGKLINNNTEAIKAYLTQLEKQIKLKAAQEELEELYRKKRLQEKDVQTQQTNYEQVKRQNPIGVVYGGDAGIEAQRHSLNRISNAEKALDKANDKLKDTQAQIEVVEKEIEQSSLSSKNDLPQSNISKEIKDATNRIKTLKQEIADLRSGKIQTEEGKTVESVIEAKTKDLQQAEKSLETLTGVKQDKGLHNNRLKQQEQLAEQLLSIRRKNQQDEINLMEDGTKRKLKQIDLDYQKELDAIKKQKAEWEKTQGGKLTEEQTSLLGERASNNAKAREKAISAVNKEELEANKKAWQEYYIEFGNYQEKRKNLVQKYNDELAKLQKDSPEYAIKEAEKSKAIEQLDEQYGKSAKAMADLFEDASDKSVNAIQAIIDKYELLVSYLSGGNGVTVEDLKAVGFTDKDLKSIEDGTINIKDVTDSIKNLKGTLTGKSPFKKFSEDIKEGIGGLKNAKGDTDAIGRGISKIGNAVVEFSGPLKEFSSNIGDIFGLDDSKIQGAIDAVSGLGQTAAGVSQIMSGDIVGGSMSAVSGISSVVSALDGMFGADYSHYNEMVEEYNKLNEIWDELIDKKLEYINTSYGAEADKVGKEALELVNKSIEAYRILGRERLNSGASAGSHSIGKRMAKNTTSSDWQDIADALDMSVKDAKDFIGTGRMTGLFDLTTEQLEKLKSEAPTFWAKLDGDVRNYLDKIIEGEERIEEIHNQINEQLTQTTFDGVYSNFIDTLMDIKTSSKDAAEDVSEYFMQAMLSEKIGTLYQDKLKKWYEKFAKGMEDGSLTESERNALNAEYMGYIEEAMKLRDELAAVTGYDKISQESYSQSSSSRGFGTEMTHEDAGELSGRFTALQIAGEEIKNQNIIQSQSLNLLTVKADALLSINTETRNIADDTRDLIAQSYLELVQISENTGAIVKPIIQIQKDMAEVKNNTSKL